MTLPAAEDQSENLWVQWAVKDPAGAAHFWEAFQAFVTRRPNYGGRYLYAASLYLEEHKLQAVGAEVEKYAEKMVDEV